MECAEHRGDARVTLVELLPGQPDEEHDDEEDPALASLIRGATPMVVRSDARRWVVEYEAIAAFRIIDESVYSMTRATGVNTRVAYSRDSAWLQQLQREHDLISHLYADPIHTVLWTADEIIEAVTSGMPTVTRLFPAAQGPQ